MFKIQIPEPCHEDWSKMTPTNRGAYCEACCKEVTDFTRMTDEEVQHYFLNKTGGNTCGRFRHEQLHRIHIHLPENLFIRKMAGWKKYMAVVLLAFGSMLFGCDVAMRNKAEDKAAESNTIKKVNEKMDENCDSKGYVGGFAFTADSVFLSNNYLKREQYTTATYGFTIMVSDTTSCLKSTEDTLQVKTDTSFATTSDTAYNDIIVPTDDTLLKKATLDTSGCKGAGFY